MAELAAEIGIVGNCQAALLREAVQSVAGETLGPIFYHSFDAEPTPARQQDLARCQLLLVQDIKENEDYLERIGVPTCVKRIDFPCLRFSSFWPFDDLNGWRDSFARAQDASDPDIYYDGALGRLRRDGVPVEERLSTYRELAIKGAIDPRRLHDFETRRLEEQDRRFGCTTGAAILAWFQTAQIFYAVTRPSGALIEILLRYVLDRLGVRENSAAPDLDRLCSVQVPVHPQVAQRLGLTWATPAKLYAGKDGQDRTWDTYVRDYIARYG